ncbi:MAG: TonB-dependent receptor domain-containing protein, partial [Burkholderiales bacterium]
RADAMGGVVQIFTKQGEGAPHASVMVGYGAYDTRTVDASVAGVGTGDNKIHYALNAARDESNGFPATTPSAPFGVYKPGNDGYDKDSVSGQLSMDVAAGHVLGLSFLQSRNSAQFDDGPGYDDHDIENLHSTTLYSRDRLSSGWTSLLQVAQSEDKFWSTNGPNWLAYGETPNNTFDTTQTHFSWQNDFALGDNSLQLIAERREEKVDTDAGVSGERNTNSIAALYQWKSGNQLAAVSVRDDDSRQYGSQTTGNLAYGYHLTNALRVNASLGSSFRAPTFNELYYPYYGNSLLNPEKGKNAEAGLYYDDGKSRASVVYYRNRITDLIEYDSSCMCAINVDKAVLSGLSLGGSTRLGSFALHGSLDIQDPRDETTDTLLPRRARQHGSIGVDYRGGKVQAGVDSVFSGKRYDDPANTVVLGGYGLLNLHASIELGAEWTLLARWNNLLNKDYELAYGYTTPGSNLFVGLRYGYK